MTQQNAIGEAQTLILKSSTLPLIHCAPQMLWNELKYFMTYLAFEEKQLQYHYTCTDPGIFARGGGGSRPYCQNSSDNVVLIALLPYIYLVATTLLPPIQT